MFSLVNQPRLCSPLASISRQIKSKYGMWDEKFNIENLSSFTARKRRTLCTVTSFSQMGNANSEVINKCATPRMGVLFNFHSVTSTQMSMMGRVEAQSKISSTRDGATF
jgi:hypothetical protein